MKHFRRVQWFRRTEEVVAPEKAEYCVFPMDFGCEYEDVGGCAVVDYCSYDHSTCGGSDACYDRDMAGGCIWADDCGADHTGGCIRDYCSFDDPFCNALDFGSS